MDEVVNADNVSVVRPIDLPLGTYSPDAVVTIDSGNRSEPLKKLPLGELMPNTNNASVFAAAGTTLSEDGEFSVAGVLLATGDGIRSENGNVYLDAGNYHLSATFIVWSGSDVADRVIDTVMEASLGSTHALVTEVGTAYDMSLPDNYTTVTMACDLAVNGSNTELHLSVNGLPDDSEDEYGFVNVTVERLSVHRITSVATAGGGGGGDCKVFIGTVESTLDDYINAMMDGKVVYLRAPLDIPSADTNGFPLDVLLQGPNLSFTDWPEHYSSRAEAIEAIRANLDCLFEFRGELRLRIGDTGDFIIGYCLEISPDSLFSPNYMYSMIGPELVLEYVDSDILLDGVIPLAYDANDEVVIDKEKLGYVLSAIHQQGIPVKVLTGAAELGDNYHYMMELDAGYSDYPLELAGVIGVIEFRASELIYMFEDDYTGDWIHMDVPNPCAIRLMLQYDSDTDTNTLEPVSYPQGPGFQKRYIPITFDTAWTTLYSIFAESDTPPQGVALFLSEYGIVEPLFFDFCQFYIKRNAESGYERIQIIFSFYNLQHVMFMKNGDDDAVVMYGVGNTYWDGNSILHNLNSPWTHVTDDMWGLHYDSVKNESYLTLRNRCEYRIYWNGAPSPDDATLVVSMQELPPYEIMCHSRIYCKNDSTSDVSVVIGDLTISVSTGVWLLDISGTSNENGGQAIVTKHEAFESVNIPMEFVSVYI